MNAYDFTLISNGQRTTRKIIAHGTFQATCIGIRMSSFSGEQVRITCKPARKL